MGGTAFPRAGVHMDKAHNPQSRLRLWIRLWWSLGVSRHAYKRWRVGNDAEKTFWLGLSEQEFVQQERGYQALAKQLQDRFGEYGIAPGFRALQIGCAVEDAVFFLEGGECHAVDPLADFYKKHFARARNPHVQYRQALGESLPYPASFFDVVICQNLLDHVVSYKAVLNEVKRVLRQPNLVYVATDVYDESNAQRRWQRKARGQLNDPCHPHTFTEATLEATLTAHCFSIQERWPRQPSGKSDDSWRYCVVATVREPSR